MDNIKLVLVVANANTMYSEKVCVVFLKTFRNLPFNSKLDFNWLFFFLILLNYSDEIHSLLNTFRLKNKDKSNLSIKSKHLLKFKNLIYFWE